MTSFWLFLGRIFEWSFGFFNLFGNVLNWILFAVAMGFFFYWCWELLSVLGNNKDKDYKSPSKQVRSYYEPELYDKKEA